jgi:polysaccharide export outer membrane protein
MSRSWIAIVGFSMILLLTQSCATSSGTAVRRVNYQDVKNSTESKDISRNKLESALPEEKVKNHEAEKGKEKLIAPNDKTYVRMNAEIVSRKDYMRSRFEGKKVIFPDELPPTGKYEYRIGIDDVLHILFWNHPDLTMDVNVRKDGQISFPLIGNIKAEGMTVPELEQELQKGFDRFIENPQININPKEVNSERIFIIGQVRKLYATTSGVRPEFYLKGGRTLLDALSDVEFYSDADLAATYVTRKDIIIPVNLKTLLMDGDLTQNIHLMAEDRIVVPGQIKEITLLGEFRSPGKYKVNIDTTLNDALSIGGGVNRDTADLYMAYVARKGQILPVNLKRLTDYGDLSQNVLVEDRDVVYIPNIQEKKFFVLGEVMNPKVIYFRDPIDLIEAIAQVGGFTPIATRTQVVIVRGDVRNPQIYEINALDMMKGKSLERFTLQKGDIVYVPRWKIADWNIFVGQILPTLAAIDIIDAIQARH